MKEFWIRKQFWIYGLLISFTLGTFLREFSSVTKPRLGFFVFWAVEICARGVVFPGFCLGFFIISLFILFFLCAYTVKYAMAKITSTSILDTEKENLYVSSGFLSSSPYENMYWKCYCKVWFVGVRGYRKSSYLLSEDQGWGGSQLTST